MVLAFADEAEGHERAQEWLDHALRRETRLAIADVAVSGLIRIATDRRIFNAPAGVDRVVEYVDELFSAPSVVPVSAGTRHWTILRALLRDARATGPLVADAHLAALAVEHGCRIATRDRDFARFPGVEWFDPLD